MRLCLSLADYVRTFYLLNWDQPRVCSLIALQALSRSELMDCSSCCVKEIVIINYSNLAHKG